MKKSINIIMVLFMSVSLLFVASAAQSQTVWCVATKGSDSNGDGSIENSFGTIQRGIDAASNGDTVLVMEGRYAGPGNTNLNFLGKTITVRSRDPENDQCMRTTIIDGQGQGVIVRFVNDEGPESVFVGFTLIAGDTSVAVRGLPGFFEFSDNARPTTRRLRIGEDASSQTKAHISSIETYSGLETGPPYGGRAWDGNNPFHQPAPTTDYYGSGDVDADGTLTSADLSLTQQIADGLIDPSHRADVNGDGEVDAIDVSHIDSALAGGILPGWWNNLTSRAERESWVSKFMAIDQTDKHSYVPGWFVCAQFSVQTHIHGAFYRDDLYCTIGELDGGQTVFNLPVYCVGIYPLGHAINAILIGDDPLNFDDWLFLEPQRDYEVHPGMWDMPYGSCVQIESFGNIYLPNTKVKFCVDETGWTLEEYSPDLVLTRPAPIVETPDNRPDLWNPIIVPAAQGMILFERSRDDMSCTTDIHIADLPFIDPPVGTPLVLSSQQSRLLDVSHAPDGTIHLLWKGKPGYDPGIFHGKLDPDTRTITDATRVSSDSLQVSMGRVIVTPGGEIHLFWFGYPEGIYWTRLTGSGWQAEQNLTPEMDWQGNCSNWDNRDFLRYLFDVAVLGDGNVIVVWAEQLHSTGPDPTLPVITVLRQLRYDGKWGSQSDIVTLGEDLSAGVELSTDSAGILHLAYWVGPGRFRCMDDADGRGNLFHRKYDGVSWSAPEVVDDSGGACCPRMAAGTNGATYLVWERQVDSQVIPVWNKYADGMWHVARTLSVRPGADAWYPTLGLLPDGNPVIAWSSRSPDRVTIGTTPMTVCYITQITDNSNDDKYPQINDNGQVVWMGYDGTDYQIFLYDGASTTQITDNSNDDKYPQINDNGQVVWMGYDGTDYQILLYDGSTTKQITDNSYDDWYPGINANGYVVWQGEGNLDPEDLSTDVEIFLYDSTSKSTTQITDNSFSDHSPQINDNGWVVWVRHDFPEEQIFLAKPPTYTEIQITTDDLPPETTSNSSPRINNNGDVAFIGLVGTWEVYLYDDDSKSITRITDNSSNDLWPQINDAGNIVWCGRNDNTADDEIFYYNGTYIEQITDNSYEDHYHPQMNNKGHIVWRGQEGGTDFEIFFYDGNTITQITNNSYDDGWQPQINNNGHMVWMADDEIYLAVCQPDCVVATRTHDRVYVPGDTFRASINISYTCELDALGIQETIPDGWTFVSVECDDPPDVVPSVGATGTLEFAWINIPASPIDFCYTLQVQEGETGNKILSGEVLYRPQGGSELRVTIQPDPDIVHECTYHSADYASPDWIINLSELLRSIQLYKWDSYHCDLEGEDGYDLGQGDHSCRPHNSDYHPQDWNINLYELLRCIQFYNCGSYYCDPADLEGDGYAAGCLSLLSSQVAGPFAVNGLSAVHFVEDCGAGGDLTVENRITNYNDLTAIGMEVELPEGCSFVSVEGDNPPDVVPSVGAKGALEFAWINIPDSPIDFSYTVYCDDGAVKGKQISSRVIYRVGSEGAIIEPVEPDPLIIGKCDGDFDFDCDVDGSDLATQAAGETGVELKDFAASFGRTDCPTTAN